MGDTDNKFCTIYIIVIILLNLLNHYLLRGGYLPNSSLRDAGSVGYYWSSTPNGNTLAYYMSLNWMSAYAGSSACNNRSDGQSVRCVAAG